MPRLWPFISLLSFWLLDLLLSVGAVPTNRTIDDSLGDSVTGTKPVYRPPIAGGVWADQTCPAGKCAIRPSTQSAFKDTWTAATYLPSLGSISIELNFKGTAIYVYFILANNVAPGVTTETACNFILDGSHAGSFSHTPSSSTQFEYNALVFSTNNLQNSAHKLTIETSDVDHDIFLNFDYAIYTSEDTVIDTSPSPLPSTSTTSSSSTTSTASSSTKTFNPLNSSSTSSGSTPATPTNIPSDSNNNGGDNSPSTNNSNVSNDTSSSSKTNFAAIAGGAVGGVAVLAAAIFGLLFCLRRRRKRFDLTNDSPSNNNTAALVNPFNDSVTSISVRHTNMPSSNLPMDQGFSPAVTYNDLGQSSKIPTGERTTPRMLSNSDSPSDGGVNEVHTRPPPTPPVLRKPPFPSMDETLVPLMEGDDGKPPEQTRNLPSQEQEIWRMRDQMQVLSEQIQLLRSQRGSEPAQRFSEEPPPSYMSPFPGRDSYYRQ